MELSPQEQAELEALLRMPKLHWRQKRRLRVLQFKQEELRSHRYTEEHALGVNEPNPKYVPPHTYPTQNTRVGFTGSRDINAVIDYEQIIRNNYQIQEAFPKGALETQRHYIERVTRELMARKQNMDLLNEPVIYNPTPLKGYFPEAKRVPKQRLYTTLDIETDDYGRPISISASHLQWNKKLHDFQVIDSYQRFYLAENVDLLKTFETHGMTSAKLLSLRDQQKAKYHLKYDPKEQEDLAQYLGDSIVIGHNIIDFDLPHLFVNKDIWNSTIDTLKVSRSIWKGRENALHNVFYRLYGKTMEEMGLSHHDPNADTIASAMIAKKLFGAKGIVGASLRFIRESIGSYHTAEWDDMLESMVTSGMYNSMYQSGNLNEVFMSKEKIYYDAEGNPIGTGKELDQMGASLTEHGELLSGDTAANLQHVQEAVHSIARDLTRLKQDLGKESAGVGTRAITGDLEEAVNQFNNIKRVSLVKELSRMKGQDAQDALLESAGYNVRGEEYNAFMGWASRIKNEREQRKNERFEHERDRRIEKYKKYHPHQLSEADEKALRATRSFEELADALEDVTRQNEKYMGILQAIGSIKFYNPNNLITTAKGQWSGIMGASGGVVPNFIRNPISRLGEATWNAVDRSMSPWNAVGRTAQATIGNVAGQMTKSSNLIVAGVGAGLGSINALSQIGGNYAQAKLEMFGLNLQNNLNTLGGLISWITTPFQLLHKAIKLVTGSLGGLTFKINNIMASGIGAMSQMGNPLTELTGVTYSDYLKLGLMDTASLLKGGSTNAAIEEYGMTAQKLKLGQLDERKMVASSLLGVFTDTYLSRGGNTQEAYYNSMNNILRSMEGGNEEDNAFKMSLLQELSPTMAQTIRSARMLGITDIRQMADPNMTGNGMYWREIRSNRLPGERYSEEQRFRRTQFEYGVASQQFGFTKMRFADRIWNVIGRDLYNGFNKMLDAFSDGDWKGTIDSFTEMWTKVRKTFKSLWEGDGDTKGLGASLSAGLDGAKDKFKKWGWDIAISIVDIWNQLFRTVLDKGQALIAYLSTVQVDFVRDKKTGKWGIDISTIKDASWAGNKLLYNTDSSYNTGRITKQTPVAGAEGFTALIDKVFPYMSPYEKQTMTKDRLAAILSDRTEIMKHGGIMTPRFDLPEYHLHGLNLDKNPELIGPLLDYLTMYESGGTGLRPQAAAAMSSALRPYFDDEALATGILDWVDKIANAAIDGMITARDLTIGDKKDETAFKFEFFSEGEQKGAIRAANGRVTFEGMSPLSSVGIGKGISFKVTQSAGN